MGITKEMGHMLRTDRLTHTHTHTYVTYSLVGTHTTGTAALASSSLRRDSQEIWFLFLLLFQIPYNKHMVHTLIMFTMTAPQRYSVR